MATWGGRQCELPYATCAGIGGYQRPRTRPSAPRRSAARPCGTKAALTAERRKRGSRQGAAAGFRRTIDGEVEIALISPDCENGDVLERQARGSKRDPDFQAWDGCALACESVVEDFGTESLVGLYPKL